MHWILLLALVDAAPSLPVRLYRKDGVSAALVEQGRDVADRVFARADVAIAWIDCGTGPAADGRCAQSLGPAEVVVRIEQRAIGRAVDACGAAFVHSSALLSRVTTLSVDCIARTADRFDVSTAVVFGVVLAHEIGHLLLGPAHAGAGVMCARLNRPLLECAARGPVALASTASERAALHRVLESGRHVASVNR